MNLSLLHDHLFLFFLSNSAVSNKILQLEAEAKSQPHFNKLYSTVGRLSSQTSPFLPPLLPPSSPSFRLCFVDSVSDGAFKGAVLSALVQCIPVAANAFFKNRPTKLSSLLNRGDPLYVKSYIRGWCNVNIFCSRSRLFLALKEH